jgi:hypothetical protein
MCHHPNPCWNSKIILGELDPNSSKISDSDAATGVVVFTQSFKNQKYRTEWLNTQGFTLVNHYWCRNEWLALKWFIIQIYRYRMTSNQFCGSELIFFGFGSTNFFRIRIRILRLIFWPQIFLNVASNCFHMCSGTCTSEKKIIFLFQVFDLRFLTQIFILQQCLDPNPYPNPNFFRIRIQQKLLDSFGFGSTTLLQTISHN